MHRFAFFGFVITGILFAPFKTLSVITSNAENQTNLLLQWNSCSLQINLTLNSIFAQCHVKLWQKVTAAEHVLNGINVISMHLTVKHICYITQKKQNFHPYWEKHALRMKDRPLTWNLKLSEVITIIMWETTQW